MLVTFRGYRYSNNTGSDFQIGLRKFITSPVRFLSVPLHSQISADTPSCRRCLQKRRKNENLWYGEAKRPQI